MNNVLKLQDILRAQYIARWTIVHTAKKQSLAEHTFNVTMIARAIAKKIGIDDGKIIKLALEHDLGEIMTGDIPSPAKRYMSSNGIHVKKAEPTGVNDAHFGVAYEVVKAADLIENIEFLKENAIGRHAGGEVGKLYDITTGLINSMSEKVSSAANTVWFELSHGDFTGYE